MEYNNVITNHWNPNRRFLLLIINNKISKVQWLNLFGYKIKTKLILKVMKLSSLKENIER